MIQLFGVVSPVNELKGVIFRIPYEGNDNSAGFGFCADFHIRTNALCSYTIENFTSSEFGEGDET